MGHLEFGNLTSIRGTTYYSISPMEQRAFAGYISKGLPNFLRRFRRNIIFIGPPALSAWLIYDWGEKSYDRFQRKKPGQFDQEQ